MKIKSIVVAGLLALSVAVVQAKAVAYADLNRGQTVIVLHDESRTCAPGFLYAAVRFSGRHLNACWRYIQGPGGIWVHIIDEEGDQGAIPMEDFKPVKEL